MEFPGGDGPTQPATAAAPTDAVTPVEMAAEEAPVDPTPGITPAQEVPPVTEAPVAEERPADSPAAEGGRTKRQRADGSGMSVLAVAAAAAEKPVTQVDENHKKTLISRLEALRTENKETCDLQLAGKDGQGVAVHKCVALAMAPALMGKMQGGSASEVSLPDISMETLEGLVGYMYCGELFVSNSNASDLIQAASSLGIKGAQELCGRFLKKSITASNVLKRYAIAAENDLAELQTSVQAYIDKKFEQVVSSKDWTELPAAQVSAILQRDTLQASAEVAAYAALKQWFDAAPEARQEDFLKMFSDPKTVRMPYMTAAELTELDTHPVLSANADAKGLIHAELRRRVMSEKPEVPPRSTAKGIEVKKDFIKKKVSKKFDDGNWYHGTIQSAEVEAASGFILYRVVYEDGDAEDVYEEEAEQIIAAAAKGGSGKKAAPAKASAKSTGKRRR